VACPHPCLNDPVTCAAGARSRFLNKPPAPNRKLRRKFSRFVRKWCRENLTPLPCNSDTSFHSWIDGTNYPKWRKDELSRCKANLGSIWDLDNRKRYWGCKSFVKAEVYPTFKHARPINSRSDEFKISVGPIFKLIETEVYKHPAFIKHVPVNERADYVSRMLYSPGSVYLATDYTSFESLFDAELMRICEFAMYRYMTKFLPEGDEFWKLICAVLLGKNFCKFRGVHTEVDATRMSGEMCTSLGNGFSNLMFMLFICKECGCTRVRGVVEGDDGLFTMRGVPPVTGDFEKLGLRIKLDVYDDLGMASFCGIVIDPYDKSILTDPMEVLSTFGWTTREYCRANDETLRMLLRAKSLSLAHQYPGCPIVSSLAYYGMRITSDIPDELALSRVLKTCNNWERGQYLSIYGFRVPYHPVGFGSRVVVEKKYGVSVQDQLAIEQYLDNLTVRTPLVCDAISRNIPACWKEYYERYSLLKDRFDLNLMYPPNIWSEYVGFRQEWVDDPT